MSLVSAIQQANAGKSRIGNKRATGTSVTAGIELDPMNNLLNLNSYDARDQGMQL